MPETRRLTLDFDKQKYKALTEQLRKRHVTVEEALEHNLDGLYERYVPETERKAIAERTRFDSNMFRDTNVPVKKFSVITLRRKGGELIFRSDIHIIFLDLARIYREQVRDWESVTDLETLKSFFGNSTPISPSWMNSIKENYSTNPCITMLADFDFDCDTVSVLKNDPEPKVSRFWRVVNRALCTKRNRPNKSGVKQEKGATLFGSAAPVHSGRQRRPQAVFELSLCNILTFNVF